MKCIILLCSLFLIVSCQNNQNQEEELQQVPGEKRVPKESELFAEEYRRIEEEEKNVKEKRKTPSKLRLRLK